jgi:hypothetical protein
MLYTRSAGRAAQRLLRVSTPEKESEQRFELIATVYIFKDIAYSMGGGVFPAAPTILMPGT